MAATLREAQLKAASDGMFRDMAASAFPSLHQVQTQPAMIDDTPMDAPIAEKLPPPVRVPTSKCSQSMAQRVSSLQNHAGQFVMAD
jgi:hypothetical protein